VFGESAAKSEYVVVVRDQRAEAGVRRVVVRPVRKRMPRDDQVAATLETITSKADVDRHDE
jgi:hypothetical protein